MRLNKLSVKDKLIFDRYLKLKPHELSVYSFANIYIWRGLFDISWSIIEDNLCVFFKDKIGTFLYLPPLGKANTPKVNDAIFNLLDGLNKNTSLSHIENVEEGEIKFYQDLGFDCLTKSCDYICKSSDLAGLRGNKFKSKRSTFNYFVKNYDYKCAKLLLKDRAGCLKLYDAWLKERRGVADSDIYRYMLEDNRRSLEEALKKYSLLGFQGITVKVKGKLKAFTFGFALNPLTFCILYEIADLSLKGLAQFIFCEFSRQLKDYRYINIMDDSGLENLRKVKLSYHPQRLAPSYIVRRKCQ
jgi:hypothetical protein